MREEHWPEAIRDPSEPVRPEGEPTENPTGPASELQEVHPHYHDTDCSEFLLRIYEYMDGEMAAEENLRFEAHVRECPPCLRQHQVDQTVRSLIRRVEPAAVAPETLRASIVARITTIRFESQGF